MGTNPQIKEGYLVLFDGVCHLCHGAVQFIIDRDPDGRFLFSSLQSGSARQFMEQRGLRYDEPHSIVVIKGGIFFEKSEAVLEIVRHLNGGWPLLYAGKLIPRKWRDLLYDFVANHRYNWFGKTDSCRVFGPGNENRFPESWIVP